MPYPTLPIYFTTFMTINGRLHLGEVVIQAKKVPNWPRNNGGVNGVTVDSLEVGTRGQGDYLTPQ